MPQYHIYIDEAGDPGVKEKQGGPHWTDWFAVGALVVRDSVEPEVVDWVKDMKEAVRSRAHDNLHYRNLSPSNRTRVCRMLARKRARIFAVTSHKDSMRVHKNRRLGKSTSQDFYNWCLRLLLERVTEWCFHRSKIDGVDDCSARIVFSSCGGHNYDQLRDYLRKLEAQCLTGKLVLSARGIAPGVIQQNHIEVETDMSRAGLQLADIAVSAIFNAANSLMPKHDIEPAKTLKPIVAKNPRTDQRADYGLLKLPFPHQGDIPVPDRPIFEEYGYRFDR